MFFPQREHTIVYTTSLVVNRNYLNDVFNTKIDLERYMGIFWSNEKVIIIRVQKKDINGVHLGCIIYGEINATIELCNTNNFYNRMSLIN